MRLCRILLPKDIPRGGFISRWWSSYLLITSSHNNGCIAPLFQFYHFSCLYKLSFFCTEQLPFPVSLSSASLFLYDCRLMDFLIQCVIIHHYYYSFECSDGPNMAKGNILSSQFLCPLTYPYHSLNTSLLPGPRCPKFILNLCCLRPRINYFSPKPCNWFLNKEGIWPIIDFGRLLWQWRHTSWKWENPKIRIPSGDNFKLRGQRLGGKDIKEEMNAWKWTERKILEFGTWM